ncbi:MAG: sialidase family protein [Wenzhouxiangellaceae bacterium]|nr:sialidase family protein [Wenzhouxiangellaceae bacterium]
MSKTAWLGLLIAVSSAIAAETVPNDARYLGRKPPGVTPELFAPGIVSTDAVELNSVFTPDGRTFFFTRLIEGPNEQEGYPGKTRPILFHMVYDDGAWSEPRPLRLFPDAPHTRAADMSVSPDGRRLYFMGPHPVEPESERSDLNLWVSHREDGEWSVAEPLPAPVNSEANEIYSSVVADGSLYFTSNRPGASASGASGLFRAQALDDGGFGEPVNAGIEPERGLGDTFVAPDESYLIFTGRRDDGYGGGDLYVAFREANGGWGEPVNLGPEVNSDMLDYCPMVTPDGKYLFFSRRRSDPPGGWPNVVEGDVYRVDAAVIERLRPGANNAH